jgi:hypothetical protein
LAESCGFKAMIYLLSRTAGVLMTLIALLLGARIVGGTVKPPAAALLDSGVCTQPCWNGIQPGLTTLQQARDILMADHQIQVEALDAHHLCWQSRANQAWRGCADEGWITGGQVRYLELTFGPGALRLGDAILLFGQPVNPALCWTGDRLAAYILFRQNVVIKASAPITGTWPFDQKMDVDAVQYYSPEALSYDPDSWDWKGFKTHIVQRWCGDRSNLTP